MIGRRHDKSKPIMMMMIMLNQTELKKKHFIWIIIHKSKIKNQKRKKMGKKEKTKFRTSKPSADYLHFTHTQ